MMVLLYRTLFGPIGISAIASIIIIHNGLEFKYISCKPERRMHLAPIAIKRSTPIKNSIIYETSKTKINVSIISLNLLID